MFERALTASREAEFQISRPYDEISALRGESPPGAGDFLRQRLLKFEEYFGVKTHDDLQAPLEVLNPAETAALIRVAVEAFWNVAKHSGASNMYLESRQVSSVLIIRIRDDGRGFDTRTRRRDSACDTCAGAPVRWAPTLTSSPPQDAEPPSNSDSANAELLLPVTIEGIRRSSYLMPIRCVRSSGSLSACAGRGRRRGP